MVQRRLQHADFKGSAFRALYLLSSAVFMSVTNTSVFALLGRMCLFIRDLSLFWSWVAVSPSLTSRTWSDHKIERLRYRLFWDIGLHGACS